MNVPANRERPTQSAAGFDRDVPWVPREPIVLPTMTQAQKLEFREQWLARQWKSTKEEWPEIGDAPDVDLVSFGTPQGTDGQLAECYTEAGYPAVASPLGGVDFPDGVQTSPQYGIVDYTCYAKYTPDPLMLRDWNADQLGLLYDYRVEWLIPCLESFGLSPADGPDRVRFVNEFFVKGSDVRAWVPEESTLGAPNRDEILRVCPHLPVDHFYGG